MNIAMNETLGLRYARGKRAKYGKDFMPVAAPVVPDGSQPLLTGNKVEETRHQVVSLPSMGESLKIWATPYDNTVRLAKKSQNMGQFQIESVTRLVRLFTDFWKVSASSSRRPSSPTTRTWCEYGRPRLRARPVGQSLFFSFFQSLYFQPRHGRYPHPRK